MKPIYDILGIGIGPFNLGLAALCHDIPELNCRYIDQNPEFNWHPGIMIEGTRMQVPFYADLVTLADPCSPFSYMSFLKEQKKMFRFAIQEQYCIRRSEYNQYCRWVSEHLDSLEWGSRCTRIEKENDLYRVHTPKRQYLTRQIVLGTGTVPFVPELASPLPEGIFHSADYLRHRDAILDKESITIIGSGQSAAEIFYDLLQTYKGALSWFTRAARFFPMDFSKLTLELSTPDYIDYFLSLPEGRRPQVLATQDSLYKGINRELISAIYDLLSEKESAQVQLRPNCELKKIDSNMRLTFLHRELDRTFTHDTSVIILATGYRSTMPDCIQPLLPWLRLDEQGRFNARPDYSVDSDSTVFIQNAEQPTHGFNAADLSLGPYRNAVILNKILGREYFKLEKNVTFQRFGVER